MGQEAMEAHTNGAAWQMRACEQHLGARCQIHFLKKRCSARGTSAGTPGSARGCLCPNSALTPCSRMRALIPGLRSSTMLACFLRCRRDGLFLPCGKRRWRRATAAAEQTGRQEVCEEVGRGRHTVDRSLPWAATGPTTPTFIRFFSSFFCRCSSSRARLASCAAACFSFCTSRGSRTTRVISPGSSTIMAGCARGRGQEWHQGQGGARGE